MLFTTLMTMTLTNPPDPEAHPTIPPNATVYHWYPIQLQHDERRMIYENTGTMDEALKNQVIDAS